MIRTHATVAAGALIAMACGLFTLAVAAATLPLVLFPKPGSGNAWLALLPWLGMGGVTTWCGTYVFRVGHSALKARRDVERDRLDVVASAATLIVGVLMGLACLAVTARVAISGVEGLLKPRPFDAGAGVLWLALAVGVGGTATLLGARIALGGLRRLRGE